MLSLTIIFVLFGSLLPVLQGMHEKLQLKKERVAAFETMHEGVIEMQAVQVRSGTRKLNGVDYHWQMDGNICVSYTNYKGKPESECLDS
ncbi:hypothetical protein [Planomicrobium soli]|nr:hypothetical protein [Planomicrobium soli]